MKLSSKKFFLAVGFLALAANTCLAEPGHDGGSGTLSLSGRRSATDSRGKKLSDVINSCLVGRGGLASGIDPLLGVNPGLGQIGGGIGTDRPVALPQIDSGGLPALEPEANKSALMPAKCLTCHGVKDAQASIEALQGTKRVPEKMQAFLDGLSATEKGEMLTFFQKRKSEGK